MAWPHSVSDPYSVIKQRPRTFSSACFLSPPLFSLGPPDDEPLSSPVLLFESRPFQMCRVALVVSRLIVSFAAPASGWPVALFADFFPRPCASSTLCLVCSLIHHGSQLNQFTGLRCFKYKLRDLFALFVPSAANTRRVIYHMI